MTPKATRGKHENWDLHILEAADQLARYFLEEREDPEIAGKFLGAALLALEKLNGHDPSFWENPCSARIYLTLRRVARRGILDPRIISTLIDEGNQDSIARRVPKMSPRDLLVFYMASPAIISRVSKLSRTCGNNR